MAVVVDRVGLEPPRIIKLDRCAIRRDRDQAVGELGAPTDISGLGLPRCVEAFVFDFGLASACGEHGGLASVDRVRRAGRFEPRVDLVAALGECVEQRLRNAGDLRDGAAGFPLDAEGAGEFGPKRRLEHLAGGSCVAVDLGMSEG
jgi:hypothetical protein